MNKNVTIYSSDTCVYCHYAKEFFKKRGISYVEKNVSRDMAARKELMTQGFMGVPVIKIGDEIVQGFDQERLEQLLG
ncbi:glutaredoxin family protein [Thermotalea metallivorans]|uniref:Glutaredoxin-like protein NrdH n=1 Tax=Thermotalea metallivorans TaxID=520762 RepID=A0A140L163_9FIRM|nr:glutaredoxin family protein [Thermotalea metallivorans]KXG74288.1 Glutaredoxin-like protein NrdH [Thermotalea metallivorans]